MTRIALQQPSTAIDRLTTTATALLNTPVLFDVLFFVLATLYAVLAPYTKVEESFNVQASHDLLFIDRLEDYDHLEFSGVVPRTFLGPLALTTIVKPLLYFARLCNYYQSILNHKLGVQVAVRTLLGLCYTLTFAYYHRQLSRYFGMRSLGSVVVLVTCLQFHTLFYCTRMLPNMFAACTVNLALACYVRAISSEKGSDGDRGSRSGAMCVVMFALTCILFRCDMLLLALPCILILLGSKRLSLPALLHYGTLSSLSLIALTTVIDSYYWRRLLWPELSVMLYNNPVESKYEQWGVEPWHWYFSTAIPKLCNFLLVFLVFALVKFSSSLSNAKLLLLQQPSSLVQWNTDGRKVARLLVPLGVFLCLYSVLSHKELRFVLPAAPLVNSVLAVGVCHCYWLINSGKRHKAGRLLSMLFVGSVFALTACVTAMTLVASIHNYPGGTALRSLHAIISTASHTGDYRPLVHICNLAAISGASRFGELPSMRYSKQENLTLKDFVDNTFGFDYLISERPHIDHYESLTGSSDSSSDTRQSAVIEAFDGINWRHLRIRFKPVLWLLKRVRSSSHSDRDDGA